MQVFMYTHPGLKLDWVQSFFVGGGVPGVCFKYDLDRSEVMHSKFNPTGFAHP